LQELLVPKTLHGPIINDGWFSRGAAWNPTESIVVYVAEEPPAEQTPKFGSSSSKAQQNGSSNGDAAAAPRTWRGVSAAVEDWGELNTGKRTPSLFALNTETWQVILDVSMYCSGLWCRLEILMVAPQCAVILLCGVLPADAAVAASRAFFFTFTSHLC
jgi:hypothetical protein